MLLLFLGAVSLLYANAERKTYQLKTDTGFSGDFRSGDDCVITNAKRRQSSGASREMVCHQRGYPV